MLSRVVKPLSTIRARNFTPHQLVIVRDKRPKRIVTPKSLGIDMTYYVGKSIVLFTIFYCSMNWFYYRNTRKDIEKYEDDEK